MQPFSKERSELQVNDGAPVVYRAGQNFPEFPGDRHTLDENASATEPAKLLAVLWSIPTRKNC
jgi:quercetin dioxygenase-like cupin family protein